MSEPLPYGCHTDWLLSVTLYAQPSAVKQLLLIGAKSGPMYRRDQKLKQS